MAHVRRLLVIGNEGRFGQRVMAGIHAYCRVHGQWEYHQEIYRGAPTLARCRFAIESWKADGIIAHFRTREVERLVRRLGLPAVNYSGVFETRFPTVVTDDVAAGRLAAEHLVGSGARHFAFCARGNEVYTRLRLAGFEQALRRAGFGCDVFTDHFVGDDELNWAQNRRRQDQWLTTLPKPVAIFCIHDLRGQEVLWACRRLGLRVPDDVVIVGVGNDEFICRTCSLPLSSVDMHVERVGYEAARLLDRLLRGRRAPAGPVLIPPRRVVARQSSDLVAIDDPEVAAAVRFIRDHAHEPISVSDLLREVPISRRAMERRFEQALGRMPKKEIMRLRILRAKELLAETDLTVSAIALRCGFTGQDRLSTAFRRETAMTPTQYRRNCRAAASDGAGHA